MTVNDHGAWVPEEWGGPIFQKVAQVSAVEGLGRPEPMTTDVRHVQRSGGIGMDVTVKGEAYVTDVTPDDEVLLTARKFTRGIELAEEDLADTAGVANILDTKKLDWATAYAVGFDNACLATVGTVLLTKDNPKRPFLSVYQTLRTTDSPLGYNADDNYVASGGAVTYGNLSEVVGLVEEGDWFDEGNIAIIASPSYKRVVRDILDKNDRPIFIQGTQGTPDTLFGYPIAWSRGARTSTVMDVAPSGNPLLIVANRQLMVVGRRSGPESFVAGADSGYGFLTDTSGLKMRARRGFAVGHPGAFAVLENTAS